MTWSQRYALKSYLRSSNWIVPLFALLLEQALLRGALELDASGIRVPAWPMGLAGTQTALQSIISFTLAFVVFTFGSMLVAIQVASGQLTPRIIATMLLRDNTIRNTAGLFIFTLLFAIGAASRVEAPLPHLTLWIAAIFGFVSITAFLHLVDYAARLLRPVSIVSRLAEEGVAVIKEVFPNSSDPGGEVGGTDRQIRPPDRIIHYAGPSEIILAVDLKTMVSEALGSGGVIEFAARIGDLVSSGQPLFRLYGRAAEIDDRRLLNAVAFGRERTIEQDATFAFRVIVDIAIKALSPAINDPTTAVLAIDQLQHLLRTVGERNLNTNNIVQQGKVCVIFPTPNWNDFVQLTFREIRLYGAANFQIARRLRAMIDSLEATLPEMRRPALRLELDLLNRSIDASYSLEEDRALCQIADTQGLGGAAPP